MAACHMCFDYYCHECSNHEEGTCSVCDGSAVSGSLTAGKCDCSNDIYGRQYTRSDDDTQRTCCASGCASCTQEILHEYCTSCADDTYQQPLGSNDAIVCFDYCPTGFTAVDGPPNSCSGTAGKIIEYDLTYIERDFANLAVEGQNIASLASSQGAQFADTLPYKLRGAYGDGVNRGIHISDLVLNHSFTVVFWILPKSFTNNVTHTLFSKDKGSYGAVDGENVVDLLLHGDASLAGELYINGTDLFDGGCRTPGTVSGSDWSFVGFKFIYDGRNTQVWIELN